MSWLWTHQVCLSLVPLNYVWTHNHGKQIIISLLCPLKYYWIDFFSAWQEECQNYIRVLLVGGNHLFTCGTNAFTPICTNRTVWATCFIPQTPVPFLSQQIKRQSMLCLNPCYLRISCKCRWVAAYCVMWSLRVPVLVISDWWECEFLVEKICHSVSERNLVIIYMYQRKRIH